MKLYYTDIDQSIHTSTCKIGTCEWTRQNQYKKNNFILHQLFKITNTSCQLFIDEIIYTIYTNMYRLHFDKTLHKLN